MRILFNRSDDSEYLFLRPGAPLCRDGIHEETELVCFTSRAEAAGLLRSLVRDGASWSVVRSLLPAYSGLTRLPDGAVLQHLAELLWRGAVSVQRRRFARTTYFLETPSSSAAPPAPPPKPRTVIVEEADTFAPTHSPVAQAKALKEAAQAGVPFCEECLKLR